MFLTVKNIVILGEKLFVSQKMFNKKIKVILTIVVNYFVFIIFPNLANYNLASKLSNLWGK
jgi:hypothetical protein